MNDKKPMTVADALKIASWIFTAGALFFLLMFIKAKRPIVAIGFLLIAFCICPLSEKIFEKLKKKVNSLPPTLVALAKRWGLRKKIGI